VSVSAFGCELLFVSPVREKRAGKDEAFWEDKLTSMTVCRGTRAAASAQLRNTYINRQPGLPLSP
jgi:hypothetical protein